MEKQEIIIKEFDLNDVFLMSEIVDKMGIEIEVDKYMNSKEAVAIMDEEIVITDDMTEDEKEEAMIQQDSKAERLGSTMIMKAVTDLAVIFVKRLHRAKSEVIRLIANLTGRTIKDVAKMNLKEIKQFFVELIAKEEIEELFNSAED